MARIAIVGVGAIGSVVAALLEQTGAHEVILCARRPLVGLTVQAPSGDVSIRAKVLIVPDEAYPVDWVLVATKAYDAEGTAKWLERLCAGGAPVAVLQNGVEHRERFARFVPADSVLPVIVDCPVERQSATRIQQRGAMVLKVPQGERGSEFVALFKESGAEATEVADFLTVAWRKLCHNAVGILPALLLEPAGVLREDRMGELAKELARECAAVGRAEGAQLEEDVPEAVLQAYRSAPADAINSLHADRLAGRPMEIDARNGAIVRIGRKHGIATPCNDMAITLLESMARSAGN